MTVNPIPKYSEFSVLAPVYPPSGRWHPSRYTMRHPTDHRAAVQGSHHSVHRRVRKT